MCSTLALLLPLIPPAIADVYRGKDSRAPGHFRDNSMMERTVLPERCSVLDFGQNLFIRRTPSANHAALVATESNHRFAHR
jgi:hypothetical protein